MTRGESSPRRKLEAVRSGGNEAILLVDDNPTLLDVTRRHLSVLGLQGDVGREWTAALAVLGSGEKFDLLFTDVLMPDGMSGYDLAEAAKLRQPGLKVLFTTGHTGSCRRTTSSPYSQAISEARPGLRDPEPHWMARGAAGHVPA